MLTGADYVSISVATLLPTEVVGLDLFQKEVTSSQQSKDSDQTESRYNLYRASEYPLTIDDLDRLRGRGVHRLFITKSSQPTYQKYLRKLASNAAKDSIPLTARAGALNEVVRDVLHAAFSRDNGDQTIRAADRLGSLAADIITSDNFATRDLFDVLHHDYATFTHSANVAFYCGMLAAELGFCKDDIQSITTGGLLHDIGKLEIGEEILCKPGRLDESEFRRIKMHPLLGFRKLAHRTDISEAQLMMAYQHHERLDGMGYPVGKMGEEIHQWAKICAVVDVFEALTSQRPYRSPMSHSKAIAVLKRDSGAAFDPEILQCWITIIQRNLET